MITALGLGTKQAPDNVNLDPQRQFWSWLSTFKNPNELGDSGHHERAYFSGFACTQTTPAGMSIQIGGGDEVDSAAIFISSDRAVLLSTDGTPQKVTIPTAPASGSRIDAVISYIDTSSPSAGNETPGTPEYVHTIVVSGTASGSPSAPTDSQIVSALPAGANAKYYRWCDVRVAQGATTITNSNITDKKPASPNVYFTASDVPTSNYKSIALTGSFGTTHGTIPISQLKAGHNYLVMAQIAANLDNFQGDVWSANVWITNSTSTDSLFNLSASRNAYWVSGTYVGILKPDPSVGFQVRSDNTTKNVALDSRGSSLAVIQLD